MEIINCQQGTPEWFEARKGLMTASNAQAIGNNGKGLETYVTTLMAEYYSDNGSENYTNGDMDRGNELEPIARSVYELQTNSVVTQVGFVRYSEVVGASPDGLVGKDGGLELKALNNLNHFKFLISGEIDSKYLWQVQMNLLVTGRKWWDLASYNPHFKDALIIKRIEPDAKMHEKLLSGFEKGENLINQIKAKLQ